ncbi:unnamed protein product [Adineta ricciae]|uniref:Uncharacterized protein n=1 Tax=Adineta ricciae TaxID=249248 RepID=A0A815BU20_ADIRI|nr:unnamed protein product [Adineta ricciae]
MFLIEANLYVKLDKISVFLSWIDDIKDVLSMMIFCVTNRLHMMDVAFLRLIAPTNFSDAVCKVFTRAVTVQRTTARRSRPNFHVDHKKAPEIADRNVRLIQLVDLNLLALKGTYDEKKVFEALKERYDECVAYNRSMSLSAVNQSIYTYVRAQFREIVVDQSLGDNSDQQQFVEKWIRGSKPSQVFAIRCF